MRYWNWEAYRLPTSRHPRPLPAPALFELLHLGVSRKEAPWKGIGTQLSGRFAIGSARAPGGRPDPTPIQKLAPTARRPQPHTSRAATERCDGIRFGWTAP
jgi:hypothetical protein